MLRGSYKMLRGSVNWISFDADYLGGSYSDREKASYRCVKNCENCFERPGRPKTQVLPKKDTEINTSEMINLVQDAGIKKAYLRQCHASIVDLIKNGDVVFNIDAHHDHYSEAYTKKDVCCGNWVSWAKEHNIYVYNECCPLEVLDYLEDVKNPIYLYICSSPNYASPQTDKYLMDILHVVPCKIDTDLRR